MMAGRLPQRVKGEGWEAWVDAEGVLWTIATGLVDNESVRFRVATLERYARRRPVRGVVVDDRLARAEHVAQARAAYEGFLAAHPNLPVAVVAQLEDPWLGLLAAAPQRPHVAVFRTLEEALGWLRRLQN